MVGSGRGRSNRIGRWFLGILLVLWAVGGVARAANSNQPLVMIWPHTHQRLRHPDSIFNKTNARRWPYVSARTNVIMLGEGELVLSYRPLGGKSDAWWRTMLLFCHRHGIRIAIVGGFGGDCGDPSLPESIQSMYDPATIDARTVWTQDPYGWARAPWERLARLCDANRIPRSIVFAYVLDSPFVKSFNSPWHPVCSEPSEEIREHFAHEMVRYVGFAKDLFPNLQLIEQDAPHAFDKDGFIWAGTYDWGRMVADLLSWADLVKKESDAMGIPYVFSVDTLRESGVEWSSYDPPYQKPYFLALRAILDGLRQRGISSTLEVQESNLSIFGPLPEYALPNPQIGYQEMYDWVQVAMRGYGIRPDILEFLPYNGTLKYDLPETTREVDPVRDFTLMKTVRDVLLSLDEK